MANPQTENGHIDIANEVAEALARFRISGTEYQVLWVILRKTWGWHKKIDKISFSQIAKDTGLKRAHIAKIINKLILRGVVQKDNTYINSYSFVKDYEKWKVLSKKTTVVQKDNGVLSKRITKVLSKNTTTKEKKETITKESYDLEKAINYWNTLVIENPSATIKTFGFLQHCRKETDDIKKEWLKIKPTNEEWTLAVQNYLAEINERDPKNDYAKHRFSFYEFIKQSNGFKKFLNKGGL